MKAPISVTKYQADPHLHLTSQAPQIPSHPGLAWSSRCHQRLRPEAALRRQTDTRFTDFLWMGSSYSMLEHRSGLVCRRYCDYPVRVQSCADIRESTMPHYDNVIQGTIVTMREPNNSVYYTKERLTTTTW